jgi:hypothetical protein
LIEGDYVYNENNYITGDEREVLYNEVWTDPVVKVAKKYGISDTTLRKRCKRWGIPLPYAGYWSKVRAGKKVKKPSLPKVTGEVRKYVSYYAIKYKSDIKELTDEELMKDEEFSLLSEETKKLIKDTCSEIKIMGQLRNAHDLIIEHKGEIKYRKKRDKELKKASFNSRYYDSVKENYRENEPVLPIRVSKSNINRAYRILDLIIKTLEDLEGNVRIEQNSDKDSAYFVVMHSTFYFDLKEVKNKRSSKNAFLILSMNAKSWFDYWGSSYSKKMEYKDETDQPLETQVGNIIYDIFVEANKIRALDELKNREKERKWEEEKRQRQLEKMRKGELKELELLNQASSDWEKAQRIRRFTDSIELKVSEIKDTEKRETILKWLKWARDKADWLDPLIEKEDHLLGKSETIFDSIVRDYRD